MQLLDLISDLQLLIRLSKIYYSAEELAHITDYCCIIVHCSCLPFLFPSVSSTTGGGMCILGHDMTAGDPHSAVEVSSRRGVRLARSSRMYVTTDIASRVSCGAEFLSLEGVMGFII